MSMVITDRSLCTLPLKDDANPKYIFDYIEALRDAGIKNVELDYRTVMRLNELPDGVGYIFRLCDSSFAPLMDVFDFNYVLLTLNDMNAALSLPVPAIVELPAQTRLTQKLISVINSQINGRVGLIRLRGDFDFPSIQDAAKFVLKLKNTVTIPVDICPTNGLKTALDSAIKLSITRADSVTLCTGTSGAYAGLEEFVFTLMSVYGAIPPELNMGAVIRASVMSKLIFRSEPNGIADVMELLERDINALYNADTGKRVNMRVSLRENAMLHQSFVSALEKMAHEEGIPDDLMETIMSALFHFGFSIFSEKMPSGNSMGLLN